MRRIAIVAAAALALILTSDDALAKGKSHHAGKSGHRLDKQIHHKNAHYKNTHDKKSHHGKNAHHGKKAHYRGVHEVVHHGGPPPWAPAHGYRHQHKHRHAEVQYTVPFGIAVGTCHRDALGAALGAAGGGLLAAELSGGDSLAIFGGILGGALLGGALSDAASGVDRGCFGQALEHGASLETVTWRDPDLETTYQFTPTRTYETEAEGYCREYTTLVTIGGRDETAYGTACRQPDGSWQPI